MIIFIFGSTIPLTLVKPWLFFVSWMRHVERNVQYWPKLMSNFGQLTAMSFKYFIKEA